MRIRTLSLLISIWCFGIATTVFGQNIQNADKALDPGMRSTVRVNPVTRGVNFEIPLGSYPGRADVNVPVTLHYSSKVWGVQYQAFVSGPPPGHGGGQQPYTMLTARYAKQSTSGWSSSVRMPRIDDEPNSHMYNMYGTAQPSGSCFAPCYFVDRKIVWMPDGSSHEVRASDQPRLTSDPAPDNFYAVDGSRIRYQVSTSTLFMPDGSRYLIAAGEYIDRNGNKLTYDSSNQGFVDTLGRFISNPLPFPPGFAVGAGDQNYSLPGVNGNLNYVLKWRNLGNVLTTAAPLRYIGNSGCPPATGGSFSPYLFGSDTTNNTCLANASTLFNPVVLHQIVLPNGQAYTFTYDVYGEIDKVVLPTGGYERYEYVQVAPVSAMTWVYAQANRGVTNQFISPSGSGADEAQWQYSSSAGTTTVISPAPTNTRTEFSFWTDSNTNWGYGSDGARAGQIYDQRTYSASGQMLRRKMTDWAMTGSNATGNLSGTQVANRNSRPAREVEFWLDTSGNALARSSTFGYDTTYQFTVGVERTSVNDYEFVEVNQTTAQTVAIGSLSTIPNGTLIRTATTAYLTSNAIYRDRNILSLPSTVSLYNGAGAIMAQTTFSYDEPAYPLISVAGPYINWTDPATTVRANATSKSQWLNTNGSYLVSHSQYDQFGNVRNVWDARQIQSQIGYSSVYASAYPTETTSADPDGAGPLTALTTSTEYDFSTGRITATVAPNGKRSTFSYNDPLNRLKQVIQGETDATVKTQATYSYDDLGRTVTVTSDKIVFDDNVFKSTKTFDGSSRLIESRDYESPTDYIAVKTEYDSLGRVSRTSNPHRNGETAVWTTTEYDDVGRIISVTTPDNAVFRTAYSGNRTLVTDQAGKQRLSSTNSMGQIIDLWEITTADPATESVSFPQHSEVTAGYRTTYQYDVFNKLVKVTQGSQQRFFMYDSLQRLIRSRIPEQATYAALNLSDSLTGNTQWSFAYQYDENGNLTQKTDPRGVVAAYAYDNVNRNITIDYSDTSLFPDVSRFYDGATNGKGKLWYSYAGGNLTVGGNVEYTAIDSYDNIGRPVALSQKFKLNGVWGPTYQTSRAYDRAGGVISQTYPSLHSVAYVYDAAGRTSSFTGNLGDGNQRTYSSNVTYSPFGGLSREQFGTDTSLYHKTFYNIRGQLFDIRVSSVNDTWDWNRGRLILYYSSNHIWGQSGTDNNGNVMFAENWIPPANATLDQAESLIEDRYQYDAMNRLSSVAEQRMDATGGWVWSQQFQQAYTYDRFGNRTININNGQTWGVGNYNKQFSVDAATNRLGVPANQSGVMTYDNAGNLITDTYAGTGTRSYDGDNKMIAAQDTLGGSVYYTYDADGHRTRRKIGNQETWQIYGFDGELLAEYPANGASGSPQKEYGYRNGELLITATSGPACGLGYQGAKTWTATNPSLGHNTGQQEGGNWAVYVGTHSANAMVYGPYDNTFGQGAHVAQFTLMVDNNSGSDVVATLDVVTGYGANVLAVRQIRRNEFVAANQWQTFTLPFGNPCFGLVEGRVWWAGNTNTKFSQAAIASVNNSPADIRWLVSDHLGTPRIILDQTGSLANVKRHDYLPFGEELLPPLGGRGAGQGYSSGDGVRQQFTSQERDIETGLDYFEARYFASTHGRFTSVDPFFGSARRQSPQSWNRYSYAMNNPMTYIDPSGLGWVRGRNNEVFWDPEVSTQKEVRKKYGRGYELIDGRTLIVYQTKGASPFKVGHMYTFNADSSFTDHGVYLPPPIWVHDSTYANEMALAVVKLYGSAAWSGATGGTGTLGILISSAGVAADFMLTDDTPDPKLTLMAAGIEIDQIHDDWVTKGAHIKVDGVEIKVLPGKDGEVVFKSVFSSTEESKVRAAITKARAALEDPAFRERLSKTVGRAVKHFGKGTAMARAKSGELRFLFKALLKLK